MPETMNDRYGDGSDHEACPRCGLCVKCGDCVCGYPGETLDEKTNNAVKAGKWKIRTEKADA